MAANAGNQRIIPLEEGWNDEIKAKVRQRKHKQGSGFVLEGSSPSSACNAIMMARKMSNVTAVLSLEKLLTMLSFYFV